MNCWEILHIKPTPDKKAIRRAYAETLHQTNPEDNPEGFRQLREAYEEAVRRAESRKPTAIQMPNQLKDPVAVNRKKVTLPREEPRPPKKKDFVPMPAAPRAGKPTQSALPDGDRQARRRVLARQAMQQTRLLYQDFSRRCAPEEWQAAFDSDSLFQIDTKRMFGEELLAFLCGDIFLPQPVWACICDSFGYREESARGVYQKGLLLQFSRRMEEQKDIPFAHYQELFSREDNPFSGADALDRYLLLCYAQIPAALRDRRYTAVPALANEAHALYPAGEQPPRLMCRCLAEAQKHFETACGNRAGADAKRGEFQATLNELKRQADFLMDEYRRLNGEKGLKKLLKRLQKR